jgi:hypothetical protein
MAPAVSSAPSVLLLANGHVFQGEILEDGTGYYLRHKIGVKQFARRNVAGVFASLDEAYQFLLARAPKNDPDEQMKLALWCLEQKLTEPAKLQLEAVLALSPDNKRAKAMLFHLNARGQPPSDPDLARASVDVGDELPAGAPRPLNLEKLRELNHQQGSAIGPPIIFDLPPPVAVRRYQEFSRTVHLELQNHCARCHDADTYSGRFQLYRTRARKDLANELVLRANLDATLRLIDPDDPNHSRLLSVAAMTHPPDGRPILSGPNDPSYRVFLNWVRSLSEPIASASVSTPSAAANPPAARKPSGLVPASSEAETGSEETFASQRQGSRPAPRTSADRPALAQPSPLDRTSGETVGGGVMDKGSFRAQFDVNNPSVPSDTRFPPSRIPKKVDLATDSATPGVPSTVSGKSTNPNVTTNEDGTETIRLPDGSVVPFVSSKALKTPPPADGPDPAKETATGPGKRRPKIDPKALQQFMSRGAALPAPTPAAKPADADAK